MVYKSLCTYPQIITHHRTHLHQLPHTIVDLNLDITVLVYALPASVQNGSGSNGVLESGQTLGVQVLGLQLARVDLPAAVDELLEGDVSVAGLAVEVAVLVGGVAHVEGVVPHQLAGGILSDVVASLGLVDTDLAIRGEVVEVLVRVDTGALRCGPAGGVDTSSLLAGVALLFPVNENGDGVLGGRVAAEIGGNALRARGRDLDGNEALLGDHGLANVDVVAVEVVGDIGVNSGPGLESLELRLGLRHVRVEVVEVAELLGLEAGVGVSRVETLVVLDKDVDALLLGGLNESLVVLELLDSGLGEQDVDAALNGVEGDRVVSSIGCEDGDGVTGLQGVNCGLVGVGVLLVVGRE